MMIEIIEPKKEDLPIIADIDKKAFEFAWTLSGFEGSFEIGHRFLVLKSNETICAFIVFMQVFEQVEILTIAVDPQFQRRGFGQMLIEQMHAYVLQNGAENVFLEVRVSNLAAQALYKKMGYFEISRRKGYYPTKNGREDAIVMQCELISKEI